jgi:hypothetical protein
MTFASEPTSPADGGRSIRRRQRRRPGAVIATVAAMTGLVITAASGNAAAAPPTFLGGLHTIKTVGTTVPANGDVNPYGVAVVPTSVGKLMAGSVLVSNFNNKANLQGTGTTIVEVTPAGHLSVFARIGPKSVAGRHCGGVGLTTALSVLKGGWVVVGSLPTTNGMAATATAGCLFVLNSRGAVVRTLRGGLIKGPWDMTAANVLNGTVKAAGGVVHRGTIVRVDLTWQGDAIPAIQSETTIGSRFGERTDPAALVVGPTGVGLGPNGTLYVADTVANRIEAIPRAATRTSTAGVGRTLTKVGALDAPLGLTVAPNGDILSVNGDNGKIVETRPGGAQVATKFLDRSGSPQGSGALFGLALTPGGHHLYFVDDATNALDLLS